MIQQSHSRAYIWRKSYFEKSFGLHLAPGRPWWELTLTSQNLYFKKLMIFNFFVYLSFLSFRVFWNYFRLQASLTVLKKKPRELSMMGPNFWRVVRNEALKTGIGSHHNLCGINGSGNKLRLLDQPLLANWRSLFSVKPWSFRVDFNKKTFSKALVRLLWTQLGTEPKNQIQHKLLWVKPYGRHLIYIISFNPPSNLVK